MTKTAEANIPKRRQLPAEWTSYHIGHSVDSGDNYNIFEQLELHNASDKGITYKAIFRNAKVEIEVVAVTE